MKKAVLISIRPKWCEKICSGEKSIEVRKTRPKLQTPFKVYIYCTSGRPDLNIPISPERLMRDYLDGEYSFDCEWKRPLTRPPQSWCYVEEK